MDASVIADLKTVVTEACTNVVVHAYDPESAVRWRSRHGTTTAACWSLSATTGTGSGRWPTSSSRA